MKRRRVRTNRTRARYEFKLERRIASQMTTRNPSAVVSILEQRVGGERQVGGKEMCQLGRARSVKPQRPPRSSTRSTRARDRHTGPLPACMTATLGRGLHSSPFHRVRSRTVPEAIRCIGKQGCGSRRHHVFVRKPLSKVTATADNLPPARAASWTQYAGGIHLSLSLPPPSSATFFQLDPPRSSRMARFAQFLLLSAMLLRPAQADDSGCNMNAGSDLMKCLG